ncbi:UPF0688 protein C1orf174 homolog [Rhinatrema bivittatum]|uniref:UPF0688 protein C1orf174 homolog n=1 Tax=Rhinatrema bivittatum TaxID=194408 RepID=UPI00112BBEFC|nr:UPF0688 protein C1orf174 homolog [Rhinatrema bivittatum]
MRNRKFTDGRRSSARQKSRAYGADQSSSDQEADICRSTRTVCLASSHRTDKRPLKKVKCEKSSLAKADLQYLVRESAGAALPKAPSSAALECPPTGGPPAADGVTAGGKGGRIAKLSPGGAPGTGAAPAGDGGLPKAEEVGALVAAGEESGGPGLGRPALEEDGSRDGSVRLNVTDPESREALRNPLQLDSSVFWDEDSNQPMPLGRFFENAELMQDIPPVVPSHASMSRREFRKLHFKAKEEDEDDDNYIEEDL